MPVLPVILKSPYPGRASCHRRHRQIDREGRTLADIAVDDQRAAMAIGDVLDDGKPKTGPAQGPRTRRIHAIKALGQTRDMLACNAFPEIAHGDFQGWAFAPHGGWASRRYFGDKLDAPVFAA